MDCEFGELASAALALLEEPPIVFRIDDPNCDVGCLAGREDYEALLRSGELEAAWSLPDDESAPIAISYTSGTTGDPKGVVTHHRGAYLNAVSQLLTWTMPRRAVYLWTLPMFHCNGWCFPWAMAANVGTNVCPPSCQPSSGPSFDQSALCDAYVWCAGSLRHDRRRG